MPEADDLQQRPPPILAMGEGEVGDHDRVAGQDQLILAGQLPLPPRAAVLGLELGGEVGLKPAVKCARRLEVAAQLGSVVQRVEQRLPARHTRRLHVGLHPPTLAK